MCALSWKELRSGRQLLDDESFWLRVFQPLREGCMRLLSPETDGSRVLLYVERLQSSQLSREGQRSGQRCPDVYTLKRLAEA